MSGSGKLASTTGEIVGSATAAGAAAGVDPRAGAAVAAAAPETASPSATSALVTAVARERARDRGNFMGCPLDGEGARTRDGVDHGASSLPGRCTQVNNFSQESTIVTQIGR